LHEQELYYGNYSTYSQQEQLHELTAYYLKLGKIRNHVLIVISLHTALRISDILRLTWDMDIYNHSSVTLSRSVVRR